jgi:hypothetical protein
VTIADTYTFDPDLAIYFDEAFERAGMDPVAIGADHIASATRSVQFMFSEWLTLGIRQFLITHDTQATTAGMASFTLPTGAQDVVNMQLRRSGRDTPINRISRSEYRELASKDLNGKPDRFFVDRQYNQVTVYLWRRGENTTDVIHYDYYRRVSDVGRLANTQQIPTHIQELFAAGLALRLAQKFKADRYDMLRRDYGGSNYPDRIGGKLEHARGEDRERSDTILSVSYDHRFGR